MRLIVETFQRDGGWIAVACEEPKLLRTARVGGGVTEGFAIKEAVNAYFDTSEYKVQIEPVEGDELLTTLRNAKEDGTSIYVTYTGRDGTMTARHITPLSIWESDPGEWFVRAFCHWRKDERTFKVSRMELVPQR